MNMWVKLLFCSIVVVGISSVGCGVLESMILVNMFGCRCFCGLFSSSWILIVCVFVFSILFI